MEGQSTRGRQVNTIITLSTEEMAALGRVFDALHIVPQDAQRQTDQQARNTYREVRQAQNVISRDATPTKYWFARDCRFQENCRRGEECKFHHYGREQFEQDRLRAANQPRREVLGDGSCRPIENGAMPVELQPEAQSPPNDHLQAAQVPVPPESGPSPPPAQQPEKSAQVDAQSASTNDVRSQLVSASQTPDDSIQIQRARQELIQARIEENANVRCRYDIEKHRSTLDPEYRPTTMDPNSPAVSTPINPTIAAKVRMQTSKKRK